MKKVILISGSSYGAGKDTLAAMLKEECIKRGLRPRIMAFGDWVKDALVRYYGWDGKKDEAGRHLLQYFATDEVRRNDPTYWADVTCRLAAATEFDWDILLIPDLRFPNEYYTTTCNFNPKDILTVRVDRNFNTDTSVNRNHSSEHSMEKFTFDVIIDNSGTLDDLHDHAVKLLDNKILK